MVAAGFLAGGLLAALFVRAKEHEEVVADAHAENAETNGARDKCGGDFRRCINAPRVVGTLFSSPWDQLSSGAICHLRRRREQLQRSDSQITLAQRSKHAKE